MAVAYNPLMYRSQSYGTAARLLRGIIARL